MPSYCLLSIQTWIFSMSYLKSLINLSSSALCCSIKFVTTTELAFISIYCAFVIWYSVPLEQNLFFYFYEVLCYTRLVQVVLSTIVSLYGLFKLVKVVKIFKVKNPLLKFNLFQIGLHILLLVF
jgi:hypothetical protein